MASYLSTKHFVGAPSSSDGPARLGSLQSPRMLPSPSLQLPARRSQCKRLEIQASGSTYGTYFRVTTFGESHGGGVGCVIDGCPPRLPLSEADMQDYSEMSQAYRPSHADATYDFKYGVRSVQGGGRSSARETIGRVAAGAVAKKILKQYAGTEILSYVSQVHNVVLPENLVDIETVTLDQIESNIVRCPNPEYAEKMIAAIDAVRVRGDSVGGVVTCIVRNVPRGLGSPVFDKLEAELAKAAMSLPATKGFEFGSGFAGAKARNSETGGISNGETINMRIAFKPTSTISRKQNTVTRDKHDTELIARGRHDPCVVPRGETPLTCAHSSNCIEVKREPIVHNMMIP
ncbi:hypothetical protein DH2020_021615 [Rehmannia glutinosa]|uniref:chorismate synthase n=1 Tax=Rehmannia glutinosa TaxID=99300 RepID=A0ABR0WF93_REHGL